MVAETAAINIICSRRSAMHGHMVMKRQQKLLRVLKLEMEMSLACMTMRKWLHCRRMMRQR